jgi:uncharacterized membrane protein
MKKIVIMMIFGVMVLFACRHAILSPAGGTVTTPVNPPPPLTGEVCFNDVLDIFRSSCAKSGCHDAASAQKGYVFDSYSNIMQKDIRPGDAAASKVYRMITEPDPGKRMPRLPYPPLLPEQVSLIQKWINQGARNTTGCGNACDTTQFTYTAVKKIIDAKCINCHSGSTPSGGLDYSTYAGLKAVADAGRLVGAITHSAGYTPMPFQQPKLDDCKITQVKKWVQSGAPNN